MKAGEVIEYDNRVEHLLTKVNIYQSARIYQLVAGIDADPFIDDPYNKRPGGQEDAAGL